MSASQPPALRAARWPPATRLLRALPDAISAGFFLAVWFAPRTMGLDTVKTGLLIMLVEFVLVHASGFLGHAVYAEGVSAARKLRTLAGFALFYGLFIGAWALAFSSWLPLVLFAWLLVGKATVALARSRPTAEHVERVRSDWALAAMAYLGGVFATVILPVPQFGITSAVRADLDLPGSGHWISHPESVIAFGALYFGFMAYAKWRDWVLPSQQPASKG
jgi:hypothetical protein